MRTMMANENEGRKGTKLKMEGEGTVSLGTTVKPRRDRMRVGLNEGKN